MRDAYLETNREHWDAMVDAHWESAFYDVPGWLAGRDSLTPIDDAVLPDDLDGSVCSTCSGRRPLPRPRR